MLTRVRHAVGERIGRPRRWRILEAAPKGGVGAEVGVYRGDFTRELLQKIKPRELHLIDTWWTLGEQYAHPWMAAVGTTSTRDAYEQTCRVADDRCTIHVGDDLEILPTFPDDYFDWVYLDSSHEYEHTVKELELLRAKIKPDGIVTGDDFFPDPAIEWHGVYLAVTEFCERYGWELEAPDLWDQWLIRPR